MAWLIQDIKDLWYTWELDVDSLWAFVDKNAITQEDKLACYRIMSSESLDEETRLMFCIQTLLESKIKQHYECPMCGVDIEEYQRACMNCAAWNF